MGSAAAAFVAALSLLAVAPAFAADDSAPSGVFLRLGGGYGAGTMTRYRPSFAMGLGFDKPIKGPFSLGLDLGMHSMHVAAHDDSRGRTGKQHFDQRINLLHTAAVAKARLRVAGRLAIQPLLGAGLYQLSSWEGCVDQTRTSGECADHGRPVRIATDNHLGFQAGLQLPLVLGEMTLGPEVRLHQLVGRGRYKTPAFYSAGAFLSAGF